MTPSDFNNFLHVKSLIVGRNFNEYDKMKDDILILNIIRVQMVKS